MGEIGYEIDGYTITHSDYQYTTPWTLGSDNELSVEYMGASTVLKVTVIENPVASIQVVTPTAKTLIENVGGSWATRYDDASQTYVDFYRYSLSNLDGAVIQINYKDGTSKTADLYDYVDGYYVDLIDDQWQHPLTLGENTVLVSYLGCTAEMQVRVVENPVKSIEIPYGYSVSRFENVDGYISTRRDPATGEEVEYFYYYNPDLSNIPVRVNYKDGTYALTYVYGDLDGYGVSAYSNEEVAPWTMGGENFITVSYLGQTAELPVIILPNPVESISVLKNTETQLIENADGYLASNDNDSYFYYDTSNLTDTVIQINYTDGTSKTANVGDRIDGEYVQVSDNQHKTHWSVGTNNVEVSYMGRTVQMPVTVIQTPVQSITVTKAPTRVYVYGDPTYGVGDYFYPDDFTGLEFTVNFKNGSQKTYTYNDIEGDMIDGHQFTIETSGAWAVGSNAVTFSYMGAATTYNVTVNENPVEKIEVVKLPDKPVYSRYYETDWRGMKVKLTDKNGAAHTITLTDSNIVYGFSNRYGYYTAFEYNGALCFIRSRYSESIDNRVFTINYAGVSCDISGITYREDKLVEKVEVEDFTRTGENMLVRLTNEDGTTESFRITNIVDSRKGWYARASYVRAMTDKGVLAFTVYDQDYAAEYNRDLVIFGVSIDLSHEDENYVLGDVNGDGKVTVDDVTEIQKSIAKLPVTDSLCLLTCGDVNGDGALNIIDATAIQKYIARYDNIYNIGQKI